jgi:transposase
MPHSSPDPREFDRIPPDNEFLVLDLERKLFSAEDVFSPFRLGKPRGKKVRVGMEASGHARWFERLLAELNFELWIGDATEIARKRERKQKTDRQDAQHILQLLMENRFPKIWVPSAEIGICGNCYGIGTGWCRRARAS